MEGRCIHEAATRQDRHFAREGVAQETTYLNRRRCMSSRGRHYSTMRPCLKGAATGSMSPLAQFLHFVGRGWGQQMRSSACAITACTT